MKKFMKENKSLSVFIIIAAVIFLLAIVVGRGYELIFMIFAQYLILPIAGFIASICMGKQGLKKGFMAFKVILIANLCVALGVFSKLDLVFFITGAAPAFAGMVIGLVAGKIKNK